MQKNNVLCAHFVRFFLSAHTEGHRPINQSWRRRRGGKDPLHTEPACRVLYSYIFIHRLVKYIPERWLIQRREEKMSGQTLTDRIAAAQYQLTGSDMARAVCKATTHEVMAPKKKHLECKSSIISYIYCTQAAGLM